jgi:hypothetical protein
VSPEVDRKYLRETLDDLKRAAGVSLREEIKLKNVRENDYFEFLARLSKLNGVLFTVATDAGLNCIADVVNHQQGQAAKIIEHKDRMLHQIARDGLQDLSDKIRDLAPQLYVQLHCQVNLISAVLLDGILYFVQRFPRTLGRFRWRIDQKNSTRTEYEKAFVTLTPSLLQTISLAEPLPMLENADYRAFKRFDYQDGESPTYLKTVYGIDIKADPALNIGQLIQEDLKFEDSKESQGVQVADLLAAGVRRCLRAQFNDSRRAAQLLGSLMIQGKAERRPIWLLGFSEAYEPMCDEVANLINIMRRSCRTMVVKP